MSWDRYLVNMASKPQLTEEDHQQIKSYLDTAPFNRSPEDLIPDQPD